MRVLVCGSSGCIGSAVVRALRWRGHRVVETRRSVSADEVDAIAVDFERPSSVAAWATQLGSLDLDALVNCAGTALPGPVSARADRLHGDGPSALFRGAARARVARIVNVSALGDDGDEERANRVRGGSRVGDRSDSLARSEDGWRSKPRTDDTLLGLDVDAVVVRPALVYGPGSRSAAALSALARAPIQVLPRGAEALLQPIHVFELVESIAALLERTGAARGVYELGGGEVVSGRALIATLRTAQGAAAPLVIASRLPLPLAHIAARWGPCASLGMANSDVLRFFDRRGLTRRNAAPVLLGRAPSTLAEGLLVTPPAPSAFRKPHRASPARWLHHSRGVT